MEHPTPRRRHGQPAPSRRHRSGCRSRGRRLGAGRLPPRRRTRRRSRPLTRPRWRPGKAVAEVGYEWRDTKKLLRQARKLAKKGEFEKAVALAIRAKRQGELGVMQAEEQGSGLESDGREVVPGDRRGRRCISPDFRPFALHTGGRCGLSRLHLSPAALLHVIDDPNSGMKGQDPRCGQRTSARILRIRAMTAT